MSVSPRQKWLTLALMSVAMSGCVAGSTDPLVLSDYCSIAKPISYNSKIDSAATIQEIELHNSRWVCLCEKDCPTQP